MIGEIEQQRPDLDIARLPGQTDLALELWQEKGAFNSGAELARELGQLLDELAPFINDWDQDRRDASLSLVEALAVRPDSLPLLSSEHQVLIGKSYINVVNKLQPEADWLGPAWTALDLGHKVTDILGKETDFAHGMRLRGELAEAWSNYAARVSFDNQNSPAQEKGLFEQSFRKRLDELQKTFLSKDPEAVVNDVQRNGPNDLTPAARELALWYGQNTRQSASAKLTILRSAPKYIEQLDQRGVDIARFWNISEVDQTRQVIDIILADRRARSLFERNFKAKTGSEFEETSETERRALADLNLDLARHVYAELYARRATYEQVSLRILGQVDQAAQIDNPRKKLKPILKWIQQVYPEFNDYNPTIINQFIEAHHAEFRAAHEQKQAGLAKTLRQLETVMPVPAKFVRFMDRSLFDLKSANLTADCTAWNLEVGFNAWTVPVWVTNPSFNFAYIYAGNTIAAKMGLILAFDRNNNPRVIIDSIETNKNLAKDNDVVALEAIYAGFSELQNWADKNGFGDLQVCTFTNSEELTANLPIIDSAQAGLELTYDGLVATEEILDKIGVKTEQLPPIYLQSDAADFDEDDDGLEQGQYVERAEVFEVMATLALERAGGPESIINKDDLLEALRSGDRDLIIDGLIAALVPHFAQAFVSPLGYEQLKELYENCVTEAGINNQSVEETLMFALTSLLDKTRREESEDAETRHRQGEAEDYSFYDDDEAFERRLAELHEEKLKREQKNQMDSLYQAYKDEDWEQLRSDIIPRGLIVDNARSLEVFLDKTDERYQHKYAHILTIFEEIFGSNFDQSMDIVAAARYVFGAVRQQGVGNPDGEHEAVEKAPLIPLRNMPVYDRRKMISI